MFTITQQKLGAYLLKNTIGKLLEDVDWTLIDVQLRQGTISITNCALNTSLFNDSLQKSGLKLVRGRVELITVKVPWSDFFQESCSMVLEGIDIVVETTTPTEPPLQSPVLSSSFHFADEFRRSELAESEYPAGEDSQGLTDLAQIIDNILGRASVVLQNVRITLKNSKESGADLQGQFLALEIEKLALVDHVGETSSIPDSLLNIGDDLLSRVVKYLHISQLAVAFTDGGKKTTLFDISETFIRLLFAQEDHLDQSLHSSVYGMANSVILSDFQLALDGRNALSKIRMSDVDKVRKFMLSQAHDRGGSMDLQKPTKDPIMYQIRLHQLHLEICHEVIEGDEESNLNRLKVDVNDFKIENRYLIPPLFEILFSWEDLTVHYQDSDLDYVLIQKWEDWHSIENSTMVDGVSDIEVSRWEVRLERISSADACSDPLLVVTMSLPPTCLKVYHCILEKLKSLFSPSEPSKESKLVPLRLVFTVPLMRATLDMGMETNPLVDLERVCVTFDSSGDASAPRSSLDVANFYIGVYSSADFRSFRHFLSSRNLLLLLTDNRDRNSSSGLNEEYMMLRHKKSRSNTYLDEHSVKSWSDFGGDSSGDSPKSLHGNPPVTQSTSDEGSPPLSKFVVHLSVAQINVELEEQDLLELDTILKTVQKWTFKDPPEPSQPSLSLVATIDAFQGRMYSTLKDSLYDHQLFIKQMEILVSMNSQFGRNLTSIELKVLSIGMDTIDFTSSASWKLLNQCELNHENPLCIQGIVTQNDDLEIGLRQSTLTFLVNGLLINLPPFKLKVPKLRSTPEDTGPMNGLPMNTDIVAILTNSGCNYTVNDTTMILMQEYLKLETTLIQDSPTKGIDVFTTLSSLYLSQDCGVASSLQNDLVFIEELPIVRIGMMDTLRLQLRSNERSLPSLDADIYFKQVTLETCADSFKGLLDFIKSFPNETKANIDLMNVESNRRQAEVDTFDMVDDSAFVPDNQEEEDDKDWQMNFEDILSKEDTVIETITEHEAMKTYIHKPTYLAEKSPLRDIFEIEVPDIKVHLHDSNLTWKLFSGSHLGTRSTPLPFERTEDIQSAKPFLEMHFLGVQFAMSLFPDDTLTSKSILFSIKDLEMIDRVPTSQWRRFLGYKAAEEQEPPRETNSNMVQVKWVGIRSLQGEEHRFAFSMLPLQFHIDQDTLLFLEGFFKFPSDDLDTPTGTNSGSGSEVDPNPIFFQKCDIDPIVIQVDYKPKHVNYHQIQQGQFAELINFLHLDGAKIYLKPITLNGVHGWAKLLKKVESIWLPHIKDTQISNLASGVQGINSIVNVGSGIADLVLLPIEQFQKDGRIFRGITRGTTSFLKATTLESARLGSKIASGAQQLLDQADRSQSHRYSKAEAPKDLKQGLEMGLQSINQGIKSAAQMFQNRQVHFFYAVLSSDSSCCNDPAIEGYYKRTHNNINWTSKYN
jgi:hypothetical protein